LALRYVPRLTFVLDESLKKQGEILKTIDEAMGRRGSGSRKVGEDEPEANDSMANDQ
jgi:hypothetical protein